VLSEFAAPTLKPGGLYASAYPFGVVGISVLSLRAVISHCFVLATDTPLDCTMCLTLQIKLSTIADNHVYKHIGEYTFLQNAQHRIRGAFQEA